MAKISKWRSDLLKAKEPSIAVPDFCGCCGQRNGFVVIPFSRFGDEITTLDSDDLGLLPGEVIDFKINGLPCNKAAFELAIERYYGR